MTASDNTASPRTGFARRHAYRLGAAVLLVVLLATYQALSDGNLSTPVACGILLMVAAVLIWGAMRRLLQRVSSP